MCVEIDGSDSSHLHENVCVRGSCVFVCLTQTTVLNKKNSVCKRNKRCGTEKCGIWKEREKMTTTTHTHHFIHDHVRYWYVDGWVLYIWICFTHIYWRVINEHVEKKSVDGVRSYILRKCCNFPLNRHNFGRNSYRSPYSLRTMSRS